MSFDKQDFSTRMMAALKALRAKLPQPVKARASEVKTRFLAATRATQYARGGGAGGVLPWVSML